MLDEILIEFEKVKEKDKSTKNNVRSLIKSMKSELLSLEQDLERINNQMTVMKF